MIDKITILRSTVFDGAAVDKGDVLDVTEAQQGAALFLVKSGKAVEGEVSADETNRKNKAVAAKNTEKK